MQECNCTFQFPVK